MALASRFGGQIAMTPLDEIFTTEEARQDSQREKVLHIPLSELYPCAEHPFKVRDDEEMSEMAESIRQFGVMVPALARPRPEGGYELISGHRRLRGSQLAGRETMPVIVRQLDNDEAIIAMVDSNLQREHISPSEKAFAYKMKLEAMKRKAGRKPQVENSAQFGQNLHRTVSRLELAKDSPDSSGQIQRFIRLTNLTPPLLEMVDNKQLALNAAVELSYLPQPAQIELMDVMERHDTSPSISQAQRIKRYSQEDSLNKTVMDAIISEDKAIEMKVILKGDKLRKYFPSGTTPKHIEETVFKALELYLKRERSREQER
ncbi:MAG: ParB/RepB/Spo0J family partition protein [Syntrophomonadaceae bacterium]|nr:ParB/RepB/Spo0J family partition protein [Syntrophomonadaceae bacterium]